MPGKVLKGLKIIIVHPYEISRKGMGALLKQHEIKQVMLFQSLDELINLSKIPGADLILIHYSEFKENNINYLIKNTNAKVALLASKNLFHQNSFEEIQEKIMAGISGFLDIDENLYNFFSELVDVAAGDIVISKKFAQNLLMKD